VEGVCSPEYHVNLNSDLEALKVLLVTYVDGMGVKEVERDGKWILMKGDAPLAYQRV
jgi:hypothetical protein